MRQCEKCGGDLPKEIKKGRTRRYCSVRCRVAACRAKKKHLERLHQIPEQMRSVKRWVRADGKRPIQTSGFPASSTKPRTWTSFANVTRKGAAGNGLGFMLGDGVACIDLDHCISDDGTLSPLATRVLEIVPDAWVEKSCSGTGLHVFGLLPECKGTKRAGLEVYSRQRFIRITADVYRPGKLVDLAPAVRGVM